MGRSIKSLISPLSRVEVLEDRVVPANLPPGFVEELVADDLLSPISMDFAPDGRLFVTEQTGTVRIIENGELLPDPFIQVDVGTASASGERGLLGIKFHPDYLDNGNFYLFYTAPDNGNNRVSRFYTQGGVGDPESEQILIEFPSGGNHNAGALHFGIDGKLYIATGDANRANTVQTFDSLNGKILRINSDGSIPEDNPFFTTTSGDSRAIWALGLRNPFTFAIHPENGRIFINDVGQEGFEEINEGSPGANFGWPLTEGPTNDPRFVSPIYSYAHMGMGAAISGGAFYVPDVSQFPEEFVGDYFFADFQRRFLMRMDPNTAEVRDFATGLDFPVDLDVGPDGALYYLGRSADITRGRVIRISFDPEAPPSIFTHPQDFLASTFEDVTFSVEAVGPGILTYQWQRDGVDLDDENGPSLTVTNVDLIDSGAEFRVIITNEFGEVTSDVAVLTVIDNARPTIEINNPREDLRFVAGSTYTFNYRGIDEEDGVVARENSTIRIDYHTGDVARPFFFPQNIRVGVFTIPNESPYKLADVFYRLHFTVTDSAGLTATAFRDIFPQTALVTVQSDVPGSIRLDGQPFVTPFTFEGMTGLLRTLEAAPEVVFNGDLYRFIGWSNGASRLFEFATPAQDTVFQARYEKVDQSGPPPLIPPIPPSPPTIPGTPPPAVPPSTVPPPLPGNPPPPQMGLDPTLNGRPFAVTPVSDRTAEVRIFNASGELARLTPFGESFNGPIRATIGSVLGNTRPEVLVAPGPGGGPVLHIFSGETFELVQTLLVFEESFRGGIFVTSGDLTGNGVDEIIVSADFGGGPRIRVFEGGSLRVIADFFGIDDPNFRGGARVAVGDANADGIPDLMVTAGPTGGPRVALYDGRSLFSGEGLVKLIPDFFVFEPTLRDGAYPALGDLNGNRFADLVFGSGPGGAPRVIVIDSARLIESGGEDRALLANFFNGDINSRSGISVAVRDLDGDRRADLILGSGNGSSPFVDVVQAARLDADGQPTSLTRFQIFELEFAGGLFVG